MINKILFSAILISFFNYSTTAQIELEILSPKSMNKDLQTLLETINGHPDPYTKITEDEFLEVVQQVRKEITTELDEIDFYKNISRLVASIEDGHSSVRMPRFWFKELRKKHGVFPYEVFLNNANELYVIKTFGDKQISLGAQIIEINGMSTSKFLESVSPFISYETIPFRNDQISEKFEFLLYLVFKQVDQLNFKIKLLKESEVTVLTMPYKDYKKLKKDLKEVREKKIALGKPYDFEILKKGIAKINIFSFAVPDFEKYNLFLVETFKEIKKNEVHSLIIDVRGNYGGYPKASSQLFHYISESHFKTMAKSSMKISHPYRRYFTDKYPELRNYNLITRKRRHFLNLDAIIKGKIDSYIDEEAFFNEPPKTKSYEFEGDCYLLIDRKSYSASSSFASTFQCYTMGIIIGEPTGGTKIFRANSFSKTLPKTKLIVSMSSTKFHTTCFNNENEPVMPNVEAIPTILDLVHESDSQLNTTLTIIKKIQKTKAENNTKK